ncbi:MAG: hypothetical protein RL376_762 [Verrucomicrobiota bacterium]|jgi:chromate reductase
MINNPFKQIPARDTTPNEINEVLSRLALVALVLSALLAPVLALLGFVQNAPGKYLAAAVSAIVCSALLLTRRQWQATATATPAEHDTPLPSSTPAPAGSKNLAPAAPGTPRPRILILNASLAGPLGNSARLLSLLESHLTPHADLVRAELAGPDAFAFERLEPALRNADAFVIATGTHWDSWSSPLQKFLEDATPAEATPLWLGKPVAVLVTEHSTGGKGVLSRLQGVLVTLGCTLPPLSGLVLSQAAQLARAGDERAAALAADFWSPEDVRVAAHNLLLAARQPRVAWKTWPVDRADFHRVWLRP